MLNANNNNIKTATVNQLPKATHQGKLKLDGVEIDVAILENGMRVISVKSLYKLFGFKYKGNETPAGLPYFLSNMYLRPYLTTELLEQTTNKVKYFDLHYNEAECFDVTIIPLIADLFSKASFSHYAKVQTTQKAERIFATLYLKGATELIDEALLHKRKPRRMLDSKPYFLKEPPHVEEATIPYGDVNITVAVVEDTHVILATDIYKIMGMKVKSNLTDGLPAYASPKFLRKHLKGSLRFMLTTKIAYKNKQNKVQHGYDIYVIERLYKTYTKAFIAGDIKTQKAMDRYRRLKRMFMNVSLVGLLSMVDDAVGYVRKEDETNVSILNELLTKHAVSTYISEYDETFYVEIFRLFKLDYKEYRYTPQYIIADFVNEYVYDTMEKGLSAKLKKLRGNDKSNNINNPYRLRHYFTEEAGAYVLQMHLTNIIAILKKSETLEDFYAYIKEHPITITKERLIEINHRLDYFKQSYIDSSASRYGNFISESNFILMSIKQYYNGTMEDYVFDTTIVQSKFIPKHIKLPYGVYVSKALYNYLNEPSYFDTVPEEPEEPEVKQRTPEERLLFLYTTVIDAEKATREREETDRAEDLIHNTVDTGYNSYLASRVERLATIKEAYVNEPVNDNNDLIRIMLEYI